MILQNIRKKKAIVQLQKEHSIQQSKGVMDDLTIHLAANFHLCLSSLSNGEAITKKLCWIGKARKSLLLLYSYVHRRKSFCKI